MPVEGKDFVIKDRRSLDSDGKLKEDSPENRKQEDSSAGKTSSRDTVKKQPLPEVSFNSLIFSLSSSALLHLGEIADPQSGERKKDLQLAKHSIDIIAMLREKTKGNLTGEESGFIDNIVTDLRLRFVKASK